MALDLHHLDARTRRLMLEEMEQDLARHQLHISPVLSNQGMHDYAGLLREAILFGDDETLAASLRVRRRMARTLTRQRPRGGYSIARVPHTAATTLAEGEFNRYYIRAVCRRALEDQLTFVIVYRAKSVRNARPESLAVVESSMPAIELLHDLRAHPGERTEYGVPGGPNSGLSVRLP
ncbi:MAG: hypothetical protein ACT4QE_19810 [Anaerolineales bacterium]